MTRLRPRIQLDYRAPRLRYGMPERQPEPEDYLVSRPAIAKTLGISPQCVGKIERKALAKIRQALLSDPQLMSEFGIAV